MSTRVGVIRGSTEQEVKSKKFNLYVGISLGNKWFTKEHIREHLLWCLKYTKDRVALLLADTLHAINYEIRNKDSPEKAKQRALKKGDEMVLIFKEIIKELPKDQQKKIDIVRWEDIKKNTETRKMLPFLYKEFNENSVFREKILDIVKSFIEYTKDKFNEQDLNSLARYVLEELPELFNGFFYEGTYYNCYTYYEDGPLHQFVEQIQKKELFPEFHKKLNIKNNIFVELGVIDEKG